MRDFYWISVAWFLIPLALFPWFRRERALRPLRWAALAIGSLLQTALGIWALSDSSRLVVAKFPSVPFFGTWLFRMDPLTSLLFALLGLIGLASSIYAIGLSRNRALGTGWMSASAVALQFMFTSFLLTSQDAVALLVAWEGMSLCAYAFVAINHGLIRVRRAAFTTLVASEIGFLALVIAVVMAAPVSGGFTFAQLHASLVHHPESLRCVVLVLGLVGFGVKSGILPMQMWMPGAYDAAPAHMSAILAGGLLNLGIFGILRTLEWVGALPSPWGVALVCVGALAVFLGSLYAVMERRLGRLLAYSSIENVGFMIIGIGLSIAFRATGAAAFASVALMAMLAQMISHALAKALCFLATGEVERRTKKADLSALGGLYRDMPVAAITLLVGSLTLAAVAPFSGFTAEWLTLQSMLQVYRTLTPVEQMVVIGAGALTAIGSALAFTAFLRLFVFLFTGKPRRAAVTLRVRQNTSGKLTNLAIIGLGSVSALYGFVPTAVFNWIGKVVAEIVPSTNAISQTNPDVFGRPAAFSSTVALGGDLFSFAPVRSFIVQPAAGVSSIAPTYLMGWFLLFSVLAFGLSKGLRRSRFGSRTVPSWVGGRSLDVSETQYNAPGYSNVYRMFFRSLLRFRVSTAVMEGAPDVPTEVSVNVRATKWLYSAIYRSWVKRVRKRLDGVRHIQHGLLWGYLSAMVLTLVLLLLFATWK